MQSQFVQIVIGNFIMGREEMNYWTVVIFEPNGWYGSSFQLTRSAPSFEVE